MADDVRHDTPIGMQHSGNTERLWEWMRQAMRHIAALAQWPGRNTFQTKCHRTSYVFFWFSLRQRPRVFL